MTPAAAENTSIRIRDIDGAAELRAVEGLQQEVWGVPDLDVVPFTQLVAARAAGGTLVGAFDGETLVGFAYGFVAYEHGRLAHHSHMLAVLPAYRNLNLGHELKLAQRERVVAQGCTLMSWTFDPLQSLNAHFNFNKLGVVADRYLVNFYGEEAASFLHRNGTDRLWVTWPLTGGRTLARLGAPALAHEPEDVTPLVRLGLDDSPLGSRPAAALARAQALIEVPGDIGALERRGGGLANAWREATRWAFTEALAAGYLVTGFARPDGDARRAGAYRLERGKALGDLLG
jgi:predicted GNAT superfamily acetyltransferase